MSFDTKIADYLDQTLEPVLEEIQFPATVPIDGVLLSIAVFMLSPSDTRLRNTVIVGGIHYVFHDYQARRQARVNKL